MLRRLKSQLNQLRDQLSARLDPVSRAWAIVFGGNIGRMALGFLASILVTRALGPDDFGVYAVLGASMAIVGIIADMGLTVTAVKRVAALWPAQKETAINRGRVAAWIRTMVALLFFGLTALLAAPIAEQILGLAGIANAPALFRLTMAGMVAVAMSGIVSAMLQATNHFGRLSTVGLVNSGLTALLAAMLAFGGRLNLITALVVMGIGTSLAGLVAGYRLLPGQWSLWRRPSGHDFRLEGAKLFRFSRWLWIASLFSVVALQVDVIMVNRLTTAAAAGLYALALNLARKADVVNHSLITAMLPAASSLSGREAIGRYLRRSLVRSSLIALGLLVLIPLAEPFIRLFYGPEYLSAAGLLQLLLIVVIFDAFATPFILLVFPLERPRLMAASEFVQAVILILLVALLVPRIGPAGAAWARLAARLAGFSLIVARLRLRSEPEAKPTP